MLFDRKELASYKTLFAGLWFLSEFFVFFFFSFAAVLSQASQNTSDAGKGLERKKSPMSWHLSSKLVNQKASEGISNNSKKRLYARVDRRKKIIFYGWWPMPQN